MYFARWMRSSLWLVTLFLAGTLRLTAQPAPIDPKTIDPGGPVDFSNTVVLFYSDACSHCHDEMAYLESIEDSFPHLAIVQIEIDQTNNSANIAFFEKIMVRMESQTNAWPRTVVGGRVFIGFNPSEGPLQWLEPYKAWAGYRSQIFLAIEELNRTAGLEKPGVSASPPPAAPAGNGETPATAWRRTSWTGGIVALLLLVYTVTALFFGRRRENNSRRVWIGGGFLLLLAGGFVVSTTIPAGVIAGSATGWPFPVMVTMIALLDGFNPCAFTVLFILLSLLTHARRRRDMVVVGGVFVAASGVIYVLFIFAIIFAGSFALANLGTWVLRVVGAVVLTMGLLSLFETMRGTESPVTSLSAKEKARLGSRAGSAVRRFLEADTMGKRLTSIGGVILLAIVVNGVELGCTAILPAVYMSTLLSRFGTELSAAHLGWTLWYGFVYVLPMIAIMADFAVTFRSRRVDEKQGRRLKTVAATVMVGFGALLLVSPGLLLSL